jgi:hypothetical protein
MKTGIQILLTGAIVLVASASFGQNQQANGVQSQKKELIIKGEGKNEQTVKTKRQKISPKVYSKQIVKSRQVQAVPAKEK